MGRNSKKRDKTPVNTDTKANTTEELKETPKTESEESTGIIHNKPRDDKDKKEVNTNIESIIGKLKSECTRHNLVLVLIGVFIGIIFGYIIFTVTIKNAIKELSNTPATLISTSDNKSIDPTDTGDEVVSGMSTYTDPHEILAPGSDERAKAIESITSEFGKILAGPYYTQIQISDESYLAYIFNTNKEVFMQDSSFGYIEVILNNKQGFSFDTNTGDLTTGEDAEAISMFYNAADLAAENDEVDVYKMTDTGLVGITEYRIDVKGTNNVKALYKEMSEDFRENIILQIEGQIEADYWDPHVILIYDVDDETGKMLHAISVLVVDGVENTNYILIGYDEIKDWKLADDWYTYNPESDDEDGTKFTALFDSISETIEDVLNDYAAKQGWDLNKAPDEVSDNDVDGTADTSETGDTEAGEKEAADDKE